MNVIIHVHKTHHPNDTGLCYGVRCYAHVCGYDVYGREVCGAIVNVCAGERPCVRMFY